MTGQKFEEKSGGYGIAETQQRQQSFHPYSQSCPRGATLAEVVGSDLPKFSHYSNSSAYVENNITNTAFRSYSNNPFCGLRNAPMSMINELTRPALFEAELGNAMSHYCQKTPAVLTCTDNKPGSDKDWSQLQRELAVKMELSGSQLKQRPLAAILASNPGRSVLTKVLQCRAEIYGDSQDPKMFIKNSDLGGKSRTIMSRNNARSLLASAPLLVAQIGALELNEYLMQGNDAVLNELRLDMKMTLAELFSKLKCVPPLTIIKLFNRSLADSIKENLLKHSGDLDFVQDVLSSVASHTALNPILNSVHAGFCRKRDFGRFKDRGISLELDLLQFQNTKSELDDDLKVKEITAGRKRRGGNAGFTNPSRSPNFCTFFQKRTGCLKSARRCKFVHKCIVCGDSTHGAYNCSDRHGVRPSNDVRRSRSGG